MDAHETWRKGNVELLIDAAYADLTLTCDSGACFKVHRAIVCPRVPVLKKMCDGPFVEGASREVKLFGDEKIAKKMIDYIYLNEYNSHDEELRTELIIKTRKRKPEEPDGNVAVSRRVVFERPPAPKIIVPSSDSGDSDSIELTSEDEMLYGDGPIRTPWQIMQSRLYNDLRVWVMADYYDIVDLQNLSAARLCKQMTRVVKVLPHPDEYTDLLVEAYATVPAIRPCMREALLTGILRLAHKERWTNISTFRDALCQNPDLLLDYTRMMRNFEDNMRDRFRVKIKEQRCEVRLAERELASLKQSCTMTQQCRCGTRFKAELEQRKNPVIAGAREWDLRYRFEISPG